MIRPPLAGGPASQDQNKDQRSQIPPDRARRPRTPNPLRSAVTGLSATSSDETMLHGMQEVRGPNPLSSTIFRVSVRGKRPKLLGLGLGLT
jgi:hypothetical protein